MLSLNERIYYLDWLPYAIRVSLAFNWHIEIIVKARLCGSVHSADESKDRVDNWITCHRINKLFMSAVEMEGLIEIHRYDTILFHSQRMIRSQAHRRHETNAKCCISNLKKSIYKYPFVKRKKIPRKSISLIRFINYDTKFRLSYFALIHAGCFNLFACWRKKLKIHLWQFFLLSQLLYLIYVLY